MYRLHVLIPLIILLGLLSTVILFSLAARPPHPASPTMSQTGDAVAVRVSLSLPKTRLSYGQPVTVGVTVVNSAPTPYTYTFPTLCTNPVFLVDGQLLAVNVLCGQQETTVRLAAYEEKQFSLRFEPLDPAMSAAPATGAYALQQGSHQLQAAWGDRISQGVTIYVQN